MSAMKFWMLLPAALASAAEVAGNTNDSQEMILLESFQDAKHSWKQMNDPVMGGRSTGSFHVEGGVGVFQGDVVDVPFLQAPGFIQARTVDTIPFPDVSACTALQLVVKTDNPEYTGYRVSFGNAHAPGGKWHAYGYKANLKGVTTDFSSIVIDFDDFTDFWDDATGDPIHTCQENKMYCPDERTLENMKTVAVWAEGVAGTVSLHIQSISAVNCSSSQHQQQHETSEYERYTRHLLRGLSNQLSLSTLFLNHLWN